MPLLQQLTNMPNEIKTITTANKKRIQPGSYRVYTINDLPELCAIVQQSYNLKASRNELDDALDETEAKTIRFVITADYCIFFAEEGAPSLKKSVPAHEIMAGGKECLVAGNLVLTDAFNSFNCITNKSGDFKHSLCQLQHAIVLLQALVTTKASHISLTYPLKVGTGLGSEWITAKDNAALESLRSSDYKKFPTVATLVDANNKNRIKYGICDLEHQMSHSTDKVTFETTNAGAMAPMSFSLRASKKPRLLSAAENDTEKRTPSASTLRF